jgi:hypothetical protein
MHPYHITKCVHVPIRNENINAYFQGNAVTLVGKFEVPTIEKSALWIRHILHLPFFNLNQLSVRKELVFIFE